MVQTRRARLQGGAVSWHLWRDTTLPGQHVENFVEASWLDHLRRFERLTVGDARLRERRLALHRGETPPRVTRYIERSLATR